MGRLVLLHLFAEVELWRPRNEWGYVGGSVTLLCRRSTQQVVWTFVQYGSMHSVVVSSGCSGSRILAGYRVDTSGGAYLLIIERLTLDHAGTYTCTDLTSSQLSVAAQLVLGLWPLMHRIGLQSHLSK